MSKYRNKRFPLRTPEQIERAPAHIDAALQLLRDARTSFSTAGAVKTVARIDAAIASAYGARRHAGRLKFNQECECRGSATR